MKKATSLVLMVLGFCAFSLLTARPSHAELTEEELQPLIDAMAVLDAQSDRTTNAYLDYLDRL